MNLSELLAENGLQQDLWSETLPTFGIDNQVRVIGWTGVKKYTDKPYIVYCEKCAGDSELFGEGYFKIVKHSLLSGSLPCGCGKLPKWSENQWKIIAERRCRFLGYSFLGFIGQYKGGNTKVSVCCDLHGIWDTTTIMSLVKQCTGCPKCGTERTKQSFMRTEDLIKLFFSSGSFHPDTKFWRSERQTTQGASVYWFMLCPSCGEQGESLSESLKNGYLPCACARTRQKECYINIITDKQSILAVKFGIANNSKARLKKQNHSGLYDLVSHVVYSFPTTTSCKAAERECLFTLSCKVLAKEELWDGYTETTSVMNINKITDIYEKHGGVLVCPVN